MREKIEHIFKYLPALTAICYFCGFVIFKSFLLQNGIVDSDIINIRFIEAGLLYLVIAPFVLATPFITNKKLNYLGSIFTALFAFIIYNSVIGPISWHFLWKASLIVIFLNSWAFFIWGVFESEKRRKIFDLTESPIFFFILVFSFLALFSIYYKDIKSNLGGGHSYKKILILKDKQDNLIKTDSFNRTDTLTIVYENNIFIYFKEGKNTESIRKDLIIGEVLLK